MRGNYFREIQIAAAVTIVTCLTSPGAAQPAGPSWEVYYQVTYADGSVRDLNQVPTTNEAIRRVLRISRVEAADQGYKLVATGPYALQVINPGRTVRHDLIWNGRAWVAPPEMPRPRLGRPGKPRRMQHVLGKERRRVKRILQELRRRLAGADHAVAEAERKLAKAKGTEAEKDLPAALSEAKQHRDVVLKAIGLYELQLKALGNLKGAPELPAPIGKVAPDRPAPNRDTYGLAKEIRQTRTLPHRVQVWKLPPGEGERTVSVAMAHPEAGQFGAFHYVAYADTDGDDRPDTLIARSPLASSTAPGDWTHWEFTTDYPHVFVGNAWLHPNTSVYSAQPPLDFVDRYWRGLAGDVYVSVFFGGAPYWNNPYGPYLSNIQVYVSNPFGPVDSPPSDIIVR